MPENCRDCGSGDFHGVIAEGFSVGIPRLTNLCQVVIAYRCAACGTKSPHQTIRTFSDGPPFWADMLPTNPPGSAADGREHARLIGTSANSRTGLYYTGVRAQDGWEVVPVGEAYIQDGTVIDRHGDPDLMADFAEEYLARFWKLLPSGRLPDSVPAIMPALLLLVTAAELTIKAFHIRSDGSQSPIHPLPDLYSSLDAGHRDEAPRRFAASPVAAKLSAAGAEPPAIEGILRQYAATYDESSGVYTDSRYYAEPTTRLRSETLKGANLVKGNTPYPVFLPAIVRALIDTFRHFTGAERLRRRGAHIRDSIKGTGDHNHGKWGLIPSTLGLAAVVVSQAASIYSQHEDLPAFREFKALHPTAFILNWNHGGQSLLFYRADPADRRDGIETISGLGCRVICDQIVGMHSRDLWHLAEELEAADGSDGLGTLP